MAPPPLKYCRNCRHENYTFDRYCYDCNCKYAYVIQKICECEEFGFRKYCPSCDARYSFLIRTPVNSEESDDSDVGEEFKEIGSSTSSLQKLEKDFNKLKDATRRMKEMKMSTMSSDFANVLIDEGLSDVKVRSSEKDEIKAHRVILSARSPVFKALFNSDMEEAKCGIVQSPFEYEVLKTLITFLYTDKFELMNNHSVILDKLLMAADYYQVDSLKMACENRLIENLKTDNCLHLLNIADRFRAILLKEKCLEFFKTSPDKAEIIKSEAFKQIDGDLVKIIFQYMFCDTPMNEKPGTCSPRGQKRRSEL